MILVDTGPLVVLFDPADGGLRVLPLDDPVLERAFELMVRYADTPMDLVDASLVAFAGFWERRSAIGGGAEAVETFTILTTAANGTVAPIHDRMPVILEQEAFGPWLAGAEVPLGPYPPEAMAAWPVSAFVNRPENDDPRCIEPVAVR